MLAGDRGTRAGDLRRDRRPDRRDRRLGPGPLGRVVVLRADLRGSKSYPVHCRRPAEGDAFPADLDGPGEQVVLDENELAEGHDFCSVGVSRSRPTQRLCAVGVDFEGDERHSVSLPRARRRRGAHRSGSTDVGYAVAWTADARVALLRARRRRLAALRALAPRPVDRSLGRRLVYREDDERFRRRPSRGAATTPCCSCTSVGDDDRGPRRSTPRRPRRCGSLWPRRDGVECSIEHLVAPDGVALVGRDHQRRGRDRLRGPRRARRRRRRRSTES